MEVAVLKTLAGFLNTKGGTLVVGVSDDGEPVGLHHDKFPNEDKMALHLVNIIKARLGIHAMTRLHIHFDDRNGTRVLVVRSSRASAPVFMKDGDLERFYIRTGPSSTELTASQTQEYIKQRF
jgi:predicted HTH transcriptional regulator